MIKYYISAILSVIIASFSQMLLKKSAIIKYDNHIKEYLNPYVIFGYLLMVLCTFLTIYAFRGIDYKVVAIIESLGYVFVLFMSKIFFNEKITKNKLIGNFLIIVGIIIFCLL